MRKFLLLSPLIFLALIFIVISSGAYLAYEAPLQPGSILFPLQHFVEEKRALLESGDGDKAHYFLDLTERRILDLLELARTRHEPAAVKALDQALDEA